MIYEIHDRPQSKIWLFKFFIKKVSTIVVITKQLKEKLVREGIQDKKIFIAPDGVDLEKFDINVSKEEARKKFSLPLDKKIVLYTGHLYKWKGVDTLAETAKFLDKNIVLYFVGGTNESIATFKETYKKLIKKGKIVVAGRYLHKEIPVRLKAADVLVLPNTAKEDISRLYTSPLKMFEYMVSKRPIVSSEILSLKEVLNKENCIFVKPDDKKNLCAGIVVALENDNFVRDMVQKAYDDVFEYTWRKRAQRILNTIKHQI